MALSVFEDKVSPPDPRALATALAESWPLWQRIVAGICERHDPVEEQWNFSGAKYGWSMRLRRRDRVIAYLIPQAGGFLVGVVLGERAFEAAHAAGLPPDVVALLDAAPRYAEGHGFRFPVATAELAEAALVLADLKMARQGGIVDIDGFFAGYEDARPIFDALRGAIEGLGPSEMRVGKSQVSFGRRRQFAWAWVPDRYLRGGHAPLVVSFAADARDGSPRIKQVVEPAPGRFMHHVELHRESDVDEEIRGWLARAWAGAG